MSNLGVEDLLLLGRSHQIVRTTFHAEVHKVCADTTEWLGKQSMRYIGGGTRAFLMDGGGKFKDQYVWLKHRSELLLGDVEDMQSLIESVLIKVKMLGGTHGCMVAPDLLRFDDSYGYSSLLRVSSVDLNTLWRCTTLAELKYLAEDSLGKDFMRRVSSEDTLPDGNVFMKSIGTDGETRYWLDEPAIVCSWVYWNEAE